MLLCYHILTPMLSDRVWWSGRFTTTHSNPPLNNSSYAMRHCKATLQNWENHGKRKRNLKFFVGKKINRIIHRCMGAGQNCSQSVHPFNIA